jgi:hypothetical protein
MPVADSDPLRVRLDDVVAELREHVVSMCETPPIEDLDTGELIRFEEDLSIVTSAAKEAVSLRRRLRVDRDGAPFGAHNVGSTRPDDDGRASRPEISG